MKKIIRKFGSAAFMVGVTSLIFSCETDLSVDPEAVHVTDPLEELIHQGDVTGQLNPFELIERPAYSPVHELDFLKDDELVLISKACGYVLVYPHRSMYVEVVNESAHGVHLAITFCPITRSGICWDRINGEDTLRLTASGYLYRDNLMPVDLNSGSLWNQMQGRGLSGSHMNRESHVIPLIETTWKTVREQFPAAGVYVNRSHTKSAPAPWEKQEFGIVGKQLGERSAELFTLEMFEGEIQLHRIQGDLVVVGSRELQYITAFRTTYQMEPVEGMFPVIMKDETGTFWNLFGEAVSGERGGERLDSPVAFSAADWAWREQFEVVSYYNNTP